MKNRVWQVLTAALLASLILYAIGGLIFVALTWHVRGGYL